MAADILIVPPRRPSLQVMRDQEARTMLPHDQPLTRVKTWMIADSLSGDPAFLTILANERAVGLTVYRNGIDHSNIIISSPGTLQEIADTLTQQVQFIQDNLDVAEGIGGDQ